MTTLLEEAQYSIQKKNEGIAKALLYKQIKDAGLPLPERDYALSIQCYRIGLAWPEKKIGVDIVRRNAFRLAKINTLMLDGWSCYFIDLRDVPKLIGLEWVKAILRDDKIKLAELILNSRI